VTDIDNPRQLGFGNNHAIEKMCTGIEGFDEITGGGLPRRRTSLVTGGSGSGKTVFALQMLVNGAREMGEPGIFVAFEEQSKEIIANAASFGWDLPALTKDKLFFLDARLPADVITTGNFDLGGMLASMEAKAQELKRASGASLVRIVFDSIDVLLSLMQDPMAERQELYRVHDWLAESGLTGLLTARFDLNNPETTRHYSFLQFMSDCVVELSHRIDERVSLRGLRVVKYRGSSFAENEFPMVITPTGIEIPDTAAAVRDYPVYTERIPSGVDRLDTMLAGGYLRGSSVLVTGSPGTAKSTLSGAFLQAACQRGESGLYISFDEGAGEIVRNMASVNIRLAPYVESGMLHVYAALAEARSAEEHLVRIQKLIKEFQPRCLVVDPLSALTKAGGSMAALGVAQRLIHLAKSKGITLVITSLLEGNNPEVEATELRISTIADTWIHLSYLVRGGERNRALTIIKARGTPHSNQVRELVLSNEGVTLSEVYTAGGEVLMGTLRYEKENAEIQEKARLRREIEGRREELRLEEAELNVRLIALQRDLETKRNALANLEMDEANNEKNWQTTQDDLERMRRADGAPRHTPRRNPGAGKER
jgi:circadian clock protein KaiC